MCNLIYEFGHIVYGKPCLEDLPWLPRVQAGLASHGRQECFQGVPTRAEGAGSTGRLPALPSRPRGRPAGCTKG